MQSREMSGVPHIFATDDVFHIRGLTLADTQVLTRAFLGQRQWEAVVPGMDSIALRYDPQDKDCETLMMEIAAHLAALDSTAGARCAGEIEIPFCTDDSMAPDKAQVSAAMGVASDHFDAWVEGLTLTVALMGFQPGFAYLVTSGDCPALPRLATPRQSVAAGSVGFLGTQCGIYPFEGPGGWPIIGRTPLRLFDPARDPPALLQAGMRVRFRAIGLDEYNRTVGVQEQ